MSRSGYTDDDDGYLSLYRGTVASAMRGKRGQAFLRDLIEALDAMPEKRLIAEDLVRQEPPDTMVRWLFAPLPTEGNGFEWPHDCGVCALGALGQKRGVDMARFDPEDPGPIAETFNIAERLAREVVWQNDEAVSRVIVVPSRYDSVIGQYTRGVYRDESPEERWQRMRNWAAAHLAPTPPNVSNKDRPQGEEG